MSELRPLCERVLSANWASGERRGVPFAYTRPSPSRYPSPGLPAAEDLPVAEARAAPEAPAGAAAEARAAAAVGGA